jgi:cell division protease FtsH
MSEEEKRRVAYHESGHALVALSVEHADPVHRVTIIPRSVGALGATLQLPTEERYLMTRNELADRLCVLLAGRSAEEIACADVSTGAENDLESATELARLMVCRFGMSEKIGPRTCGNVTSRFLPAELDHGNVSEETSRVIDLEIKSLLEREHARARRIISERRDVLEAIAKRLLATETLERAELEALAAAPRPKLVAAQG